ncbi:stationary phase inducible protein CsiE [Erwinia tasmaniensis]|uniref:Stationary phase-inducible protein n=1 Tax=Erwinia tasmaniensis (strain DSM 17950 / CFBP 7177 / CIP 109463 / NCPPB 4357 / Et1/99) TaxID=465817 RepID=B2VI26_ERWT9|nr:stationary phase inducible protein CsiE [Erwinia tasmaniensis]CAO96060.1 Stationary phase-inducible protein [Erwinia tasmaniensis Et1/99]
MTSDYLSEGAALSTAQRRCRLLLMLLLPNHDVTLASICQLNGGDRTLARQDIAELAAEIQRNHHLAINPDEAGHLYLSGTPLDQRLCLLHGLRRALRLSPQFVSGWFADAVKRRLLTQPVDKALYDEHNLTVLIQHCSQQLAREFSARDGFFLQIWLRYSLAWHCQPEFSPRQRQWLLGKTEYVLAKEIARCWQKRGYQTDAHLAMLLTLMFSQLHTPLAATVTGENERALLQAVESSIARFQHIAGIEFRHRPDLSARLYTHLAQALERALFAIGIDDNLSENICLHYPRLLRTTRKAMKPFEQQYAVTFSHQEMELVAIIFGAWLVQENALHEKQVLLLTGDNPGLEQQIEQQLRELTLLPLNIKYQDVHDFQHNSAPPGITLVISPYPTSLPLYSPPFIYTELPLGEHQLRSLRTLLES